MSYSQARRRAPRRLYGLLEHVGQSRRDLRQLKARWGSTSWTGWYRHITLALWAHAILAAIRVRVRQDDLLKKGLPKTTALSGRQAFRRRQSNQSRSVCQRSDA